MEDLCPALAAFRHHATMCPLKGTPASLTDSLRGHVQQKLNVAAERLLAQDWRKPGYEMEQRSCWHATIIDSKECDRLRSIMTEKDKTNGLGKPEASSKETNVTAASNRTPAKNTELSKTIKSLRLTVNPLSRSLKNVKTKQEGLQSSVTSARVASRTGKFRLDQLHQHGKGSLAFSSLQAGMQYFMLPELGYIAFVPLGKEHDSVCVLADPICKTENMRALITEFLKDRKDPIFLHVNHDTAKVLGEFGFCVNELGVETFIDIPEFTLVGNKKQQLRQARNNATKDHIKVREIKSVDDSLFKAFKNIGDEWMKQKVISDNEMQFIVRPVVYVDEVDVRRFVAVKDDEIVGFVIFDPMYQDGEVIGYIANHLRSILDRSYSVVDYIILEAMEIFKDEGKVVLSLGLSPMAQVNDGDEFKYSKLLKANFQYAFERANFLYNFKNLYRHKSKYRPELPGAHEEKVYCAMNERFLLVRMYEVYKVLGINPVKQTLAHIRTVATDWIQSKLHPKSDPPAQR
jgi:hypothetical protein